MTVYKGKVNCRQLASLINDKLLAEGYTQISSNIPTDGMVFYSKGMDGTSDFYIKLIDPVNFSLTVGIYEKYVPNANQGIAGVFTNGYEAPCIRWNYGAQSARYDVNYIMNITKDRFIIFVEGMLMETYACNVLTYVGLPKRYDPNDSNGNFAGLASTSYSDKAGWSGSWCALKNRALVNQQRYDQDYYLPNRSFGWASKLFYSPIFLGTSAEGPRGELDGLIMEMVDQNNEIRHLDTFTKNGKTYTVIVPASNGNVYLNPGYVYLMEV
jgi:hypothetical protein